MRFPFPAPPAHVRPRRLAGALGLILAAATASAQDPKPPANAPDARPDDPKAVALMAEVAKAYQALQSYQDQGEFVVSMTIADQPRKQVAPLRLALARPNKLRLEAGPVQIVSDGETLNTIVAPLKKYIATPAPKELTLDVFREGPIGAALFGGSTGVPMYILLNLLVSPEPEKVLDQLGGSLQLADAGEGAEAVLIDQQDGPDLKMTIDAKTKLLKEIDLIVDPKALEESAKQGAPVKVEKLGWSAGPVVVDAPAADAFAFQPPEGFAKVKSFQAGPDERPKFAVEQLLDKPAPDFVLTVLDGPGKTKPVSRDDLAGKVVVLDFWATWCGPCLMELPEIQKLVDDLSADKKEALVVALSQDQKPSEIDEVRKLVETTLEEKKIELAGKAAAAIALDPSGSIGELFRIEGLPTLVVLDGKGVVRSTHVGFSPEIRETLAAEIDALLAGKPIPKKDADEGAEKPVEASKTE